MIRPLGTLLLLAFLAEGAFAQSTFTWKFRDGEQFYLEEKSESSQDVKVLGQEFKQTTKQHRLSRVTVKGQTKDKIDLEFTVEIWKNKNEGGPPVPGADAAAEKMEQATKGLVFNLQITPKGDILKFSGADKFAERLKEKFNEQEYNVLKQIITEPVLRAPFEMIFGILPARAVGIGDRWRQNTFAPLGPLGNVELTNEYVYQGAGKEGDVFVNTCQFKFSPPAADAGQIGIKITKGDFKNSEGKGDVVFDNRTGRLVRHALKLKMTGTMTIEAGGNTGEVQLDGVEDRTVRFFDRKPDEK